MKRLIHIAILLLFVASVSAQNQVKSTGITYSDGAPVWVPVEKTASEIAIDTVTGYLWQWHRTPGPTNAGSWIRLGQGIDTLTLSSVPSYAPLRNQSTFVVNGSNELYRYSGSGTIWNCMNCGLTSTVFTDQTISGDGSFAMPLSIAQQSAAEPQFLTWTGVTWEPSWGNPYTYVTSGASITSSVSEVLIGTVSGDVTMGLPACDAGLDSKHFKFIRNGSDGFSITIDPESTQTFQDGTLTKILYGTISIDCTCRFSAGTGTWFYDNF